MTRAQTIVVGATILAVTAYAATQAFSSDHKSAAPPPNAPTTVSTPLAPVAAPTPAAPSRVIELDHPGPAGVTWGTSPQEVKKVLTKKLRLTWEGLEEDQHAWLQHYSGEFAGLAVEQIEATFAYDKAKPNDRPLMMFVVTLAARDERPASRRWLDIVEKLRAAYGEPSDFTPPPEDPGATLTERAKQSEHLKGSLSALGGLLTASRFQQLDRQIAQGAWQPSARWRFRNHVQILAAMLVEQPDRFGRRALKPLWLFAHDDLAKTFLESTERPREF